jgi:hypothetical protein
LNGPFKRSFREAAEVKSECWRYPTTLRAKYSGKLAEAIGFEPTIPVKV